MNGMMSAAVRSAFAIGLLAAMAVPSAAEAAAPSRIITFDDPAISGPLNTQYAAFGITFAQSGAFSTARTYIDARDTFDQRGYFGTAERGNPTVLFTTPVDNLSFDFVSLGATLTAVAFNDSDPFLEIINEALPTGTAVTTGTRTFTASGIQGFRIVNINQRLGISTLRFDVPGVATGVPEPGTWATMLLGFGAIGFAARRRRKGRPAELADHLGLA